MFDRSNQPLQEMSDPSNQPLQEMSDPSNQPLQEMSDPSNQPLQEMSYPSNQPLQEMSDPSNQPLQEMSDPSNQPLQEMSDPSNQPLHEMSGPCNQPLQEEMSDTSNQSLQEESYLSDQPVPEQYISPPNPEQYNHPCDDLLAQGRRRDYINICVPLFKATKIGDWEAVENILHNNREFKNLLGYSINENKETTLHIAITSQNIKFVGHLVDRMTHQQLALQQEQGCTALHIAAGVGNVKMARDMIEKYPQLLKIRGHNNILPIHFAAISGKHDMVAYLYDEYKNIAGVNHWTYKDEYLIVFRSCIKADLFDCALQIFDDQNNEIGFPPREYAREVLYILARKTYAFKEIKSWKNSIIWMRPVMIKESVATELLRKIWKNITERPSDEINNILNGPIVITKDKEITYPFHILFVAAEMGNTKFLVEMIREYPDLLWTRNENKQTIFHIAASHRHESIYNLLYEMGPVHVNVASLYDKHKNNLSHVVGMKAKSPFEDVLGAAFQMQRELLWFKEVNSKISPYCREDKNDEGHTPLQLFIENHKDMVSEGEKWMKDTANQCMVVAALITTVVFAVAFTVPGGYDQNNGLPIFHKDGPFIVFVILDAISLILSSASILMFLSILTSRYAQEDFLISLPKKLMIGLTTLFFSIITMMVAFAVSFFVLYRNKLISIPIIISVGAIVPIFLYMKLQFPLLVDTYRATYGSRYLFGAKKPVLYYRNPRF